MSRSVIKAKTIAETVLYSWDFSSLLSTSETVSTAVMTASVYSGTDSSPSSIVNGSASISGNTASQSITRGVNGVIYNLKMTVTTSSSQTLIMQSFLAIESSTLI